MGSSQVCPWASFVLWVGSFAGLYIFCSEVQEVSDSSELVDCVGMLRFETLMLLVLYDVGGFLGRRKLL
jgi:hypothetical protein